MVSYTPKSSWSNDKEIRLAIIKQWAEGKINMANKYCSLIEQFSDDLTMNQTIGQLIDKAITTFISISSSNVNIRWAALCLLLHFYKVVY